MHSESQLVNFAIFSSDCLSVLSLSFLIACIYAFISTGELHIIRWQCSEYRQYTVTHRWHWSQTNRWVAGRCLYDSWYYDWWVIIDPAHHLFIGTDPRPPSLHQKGPKSKSKRKFSRENISEHVWLYIFEIWGRRFSAQHGHKRIVTRARAHTHTHTRTWHTQTRTHTRTCAHGAHARTGRAQGARIAHARARKHPRARKQIGSSAELKRALCRQIPKVDVHICISRSLCLYDYTRGTFDNVGIWLYSHLRDKG